MGSCKAIIGVVFSMAKVSQDTACKVGKEGRALRSNMGASCSCFLDGHEKFVHGHYGQG